MINKLLKRKLKQTTFCYCPNCRNELVSSGSFISDKKFVTYKCTECGEVSKWLFDPPVPILIKKESKNDCEDYKQ